MHNFPSYLPEPEEIVAVCAEIRDGWPPEERERRLRADWRPEAWSAQQLELAEGGCVEEWQE